MKLFSLKVKRFEIVDGKKLQYPSVDGSNIPNHESIFKKLGGKTEYLPSGIPELDYFYMRSFDKEEFWEWAICDLMDKIGSYPTGNNLFVSEKLKVLLSQFNIGEHKFYPTLLKYKNEKLRYYIFKTLVNGDKFIDYKKCRFKLEDGVNESKVRSIDEIIADKLDYLELKEKFSDEGYDLKFEQMVLKKTEYDIMILSNVFQYAITERLKNEIEVQKITGIEIKPIDNFEIIIE